MKRSEQLRHVPVWYFSDGTRGSRPKLAYLADTNEDGVADLTIIPSRGGVIDYKSTIRHMEDPYFLTHPNVKGIDGAWDYMPGITYAVTLEPNWTKPEPVAETPKAPEPVYMPPTDVSAMRKKIEDLEATVELLTSPAKTAKKDDKALVGAGK